MPPRRGVAPNACAPPARWRCGWCVVLMRAGRVVSGGAPRLGEATTARSAFASVAGTARSSRSRLGGSLVAAFPAPAPGIVEPLLVGTCSTYCAMEGSFGSGGTGFDLAASGIAKAAHPRAQQAPTSTPRTAIR